jgi:hypothetical protein
MGTQGFLRELRDHLRSLVVLNAGHRLAAVGGNLLVAVPGQMVCTMVTDGPSAGFYDRATDDPIGFALVGSGDAIARFFEADNEASVAAALGRRDVAMEGDPSLLARLLSLGQGTNVIALRARLK